MVGESEQPELVKDNDMGWAERFGEGPGRNPKVEISRAGGVTGLRASDGTRYVSSHGVLRRSPRKLRGKAAVKAAKRRRVYVDGVRVITIGA